MIDQTTRPTTARTVLRAIAKWTSAPIWDRLRPRVETIADQRIGRLADELRSEMASLRDALRGELAEVRDEVVARRPLPGRIDTAEHELQRVGSQVAAVDARVAQLELPAAGAMGDLTDEARREARSLVEEIRTEHARVRARLTAIASYEQRITQVEQALAARATTDE